jgi:hypothetical protein
VAENDKCSGAPAKDTFEPFAQRGSWCDGGECLAEFGLRTALFGY